MRKKVINLLRAARHLALLALSPLDYFSRILKDKKDLPPLHLRRYVGPLESFESSGAEFMNYLRVLAELRPEELVLDIGCGCGQMALQLEKYLGEEGSYVGVDIHRPSIRWCRKNISSRRSTFHFAHIDVRNLAYNPGGTCRAETYQFPFDEGSFDLVLLKSVFTHMRPSEVSNYLREVSRLLKSNGRCLATFFLLNAEQARLAAEGANEIAFKYGEGVWRYRLEQSPESAVAYDEGYVMGLLEENRLALRAPIYYGRWTGRKDGLSYQDILLLEKRDHVETQTTVLFRPVGEKELELIRESGFKAFPPRLPEQPIFYPVLNEEYATQIARQWNAKHNESRVGYITRFCVKKEYLRRHQIQIVGSSVHQEYWIPAEELDEFNKNIVGPIEVVGAYRSEE